MAEKQATRRLAAILVADVVGYSKMMAADETETLARLKKVRAELFDPRVAEHRGRIIKLMGDGALVEFASVVDAVACAAAIQRAMHERNVAEPEMRRIEFRIGVNLGDLIVDGDDLYGDGLNVAARLESLADPGGICVSAMVQQNVKGKLDLAFEDLGEQRLKNIAEPVRAFRVRIGDPISTPSTAAPALPLPEKPSIAVLPFTNMSGDPEQEYFSDGITEDIITELSRFRSLFVIARNSSFSYKGRSVKVQEIGRDLGVAYLVEGSVRKAGNRIRVTAQLIESATGNHIWAERFDRDLDDVFAVQDALVLAIASAVPGRIDKAAFDRARHKPTNSLTAYEHLLHGEWIWLEKPDVTEALPLFEKAISIDPLCARAYCRIAAYHAYRVWTHGTSVQAALQLALSFVEKALGCDRNDPMVHAIAAQVYTFTGNIDLAHRHIQDAIEKNPNDVWVIRYAALVFMYLGDHVEAMKFVSDCRRLDPQSRDSMQAFLFDIYYMTRRYDDAVSLMRGRRDLSALTYCGIAAAYAQLGCMEEAHAAVATFEQVKPAGYDIDAVGHAHARMCRRSEDAEHWLEGYRKAGLIA